MIYNNRAGDGVTITPPAFNVLRETMTMTDKNIIWDASIKDRRKGLASQASRNDEAAAALKNQSGIYAGEMRGLATLNRAILDLIDEYDAAWKEHCETITE
jgi:hypothetical protein